MTFTAYLLVTSDPGLGSQTDAFNAHELVLERIQNRRWPLNALTPFRKAMKRMDRLLLYVGGVHAYRQTIVGEASVDSVATLAPADVQEIAKIGTKVRYEIRLGDAKLWNSPVPLLDVLRELSFCPADASRYGNRLQRGCVKLTHQDYELIISAANKYLRSRE